MGIIKPLPHGEIKLIYENRFKAFEVLQIPRYNPYEQFLTTHNHDAERENAFESLLTEAKDLMTSAANRLSKMAATSESCRATGTLSTEMLQKLQRLTVRNSLNVVKLKINKDKASEFVLTIDHANSMPNCPALDLKQKVAK